MLSIEWSRRIVVPAVLVLAVGTASCSEKIDAFFGPTMLDTSVLQDVDAPVFGSLYPGSGISVYGGDHLGFGLMDGESSNGAEPSGIDEGSIAVSNAAALSVTRDGAMFRAALDGVADGPHDFTLSGSDYAGNTSTTMLPINLDRTAPALSFSQTPDESGSSEATSLSFAFAGTITDANPHMYGAQIMGAGTDGECGTGDDVDLGDEVDPGSVDVMDHMDGNEFSLGFTLNNPTTAGMMEIMRRYCAYFKLVDAAMPDANLTDRMIVADRAWFYQQVSPPEFSLELAGDWVHGAGSSTACFRLSSSPAQPGATGSYAVSGPGVASGGSGDLQLDDSGAFAWSTGITSYGTYNAEVSVTSGGVTRTVNGSVNVTSAAGGGSC